LSRLKSARGAKPAKPAKGARASAARGGRVLVQTPKSDVFVALLGVSLAAILLGCILLVILLNGYEFQTKVSSLMTTSSVAALWA
jgi:hypothetical protein